MKIQLLDLTVRDLVAGSMTMAMAASVNQSG